MDEHTDCAANVFLISAKKRKEFEEAKKLIGKEVTYQNAFYESVGFSKRGVFLGFWSEPLGGSSNKIPDRCLPYPYQVLVDNVTISVERIFPI
jgi:hypothetical protein